MIYFQEGSEHHNLSARDLREGLFQAFEKIGQSKRVLAIPPDQTRFHSRAGEITCMVHDYYGSRLTDILPALGTHAPMAAHDLNRMFPGIPHQLFRVHNWRKDVITLGELPGEYISEITGGALSYSWPAQLNRLILHGQHDLILSIGQVVPHEVIGMANYNKNLLIGCGGPESINKSHFIGAVHGMERIMGRADNPVRAVLNEASKRFISDLPVLYILTVIGQEGKRAERQEGKRAERQEGKAENRSPQVSKSPNPLVPQSSNLQISKSPRLVTRGLFIGDDEKVFQLAAELSLKVNFTQLDEPLKKVVVYLDPEEFRSTWLGNKSIYRTRMAIADGGELIIMAPGVKEFGEDPEIDRMIRKYGYRGTAGTLASVDQHDDIRNNLSAAAHLIHGSSEGRFTIRYCPGHLSRQEIESAGFQYGHLAEMQNRFPTDQARDGFWTTPGGENIFYISNPALGLWAHKKRFDESSR